MLKRPHAHSHAKTGWLQGTFKVQGTYLRAYSTVYVQCTLQARLEGIVHIH